MPKDFDLTTGQSQQATPSNAPSGALSKEDAYLEEALQWCWANLETDHTGNRPCPWCGTDFFLGKEDEFQVALRNHWMNKHRAHLEQTHFHRDLGWDAYAIQAEIKALKDEQEEAARSHEGLEVLDELDRYDILYLPEHMRNKAENEGGKFHWARPDRVQRYKDQGMQVVDMNSPKWSMEKDRKGKPKGMRHQHSTEDSAVRANELVAVYVPPVLKRDRDRLRRARINARGNPAASQEAKQGDVSDIGKRAYGYYKNKRNLTHDEAMRMARQVESNMGVGTGPSIQEQRERRVVHRR
jgi:hypothetical protein